MTLGNIFAQTRVNPFEIKPRLKTMNIIDTFTPIRDSLISDSIQITTTEPVTASESLNNEFTNPFDVDHIPIRKSAIAKRTEKMQSQAESTHSSNTFLFWFLIFSCALLAVVINMKAKVLDLISRSILNENMLKLFQREESTRISSYLLLLYIIFAINFSVMVYLISDHYGGPKGIQIFLYILIGVIGLYIVRHFSLMVFGAIFGISKNTQLYSFAIMIFNHFVGIILIPLNFLLAFGPVEITGIILWATIGILSILLFLRTIRGIFIVSEHLTDRFFQIIVYLCAFEIAPMLIFIKTLMNFN